MFYHCILKRAETILDKIIVDLYLVFFSFLSLRSEHVILEAYY